MDRIEAAGRIVEILPHGAYRAELPNGHACIARPLAKNAGVSYNAGRSRPACVSSRRSFPRADSRRRRPGLGRYAGRGKNPPSRTGWRRGGGGG